MQNTDARGRGVEEGHEQRLKDPGGVSTTDRVNEPSFGQRLQRPGCCVQVIKHQLQVSHIALALAASLFVFVYLQYNVMSHTTTNLAKNAQRYASCTVWPVGKYTSGIKSKH